MLMLLIPVPAVLLLWILAGGYSLTLYLLGLGICLVGLYTFTTGPDTAMLGWPLLFLGVVIIAVAMAESNAYRQHRYGEK